MKYVFYVENGVAMAIVQQYINEKELNSQDVIIFLGRSLIIESKFSSFDLSYLEFRTSWFFIRGWSKTYSVKRQINSILAELNVGEYIFHTSSISKLSCFFLMNHKHCTSLINIEEGRAAFYSEFEFKKYIKQFYYSNWKYSLYQFKCFLNYFFLHYPNPNKTISSLKLNNNALVSSVYSYNYVANRYIVKDLFKNTSVDYSFVKCLMSFSYPVEDGYIKLDEYLNALRETFLKLKNRGVNIIHYKYHPQQFKYPDNIKAYNNLLNEFSNEVKFVSLDASTIMEVLIANSNAILLSDYSSTMIYTVSFGNEIISNFNLIKKYRTSDKKLPEFPAYLEEIIKKSSI